MTHHYGEKLINLRLHSYSSVAELITHHSGLLSLLLFFSVARFSCSTNCVFERVLVFLRPILSHSKGEEIIQEELIKVCSKENMQVWQNLSLCITVR